MYNMCGQLINASDCFIILYTTQSFNRMSYFTVVCAKIVTMSGIVFFF